MTNKKIKLDIKKVVNIAQYVAIIPMAIVIFHAFDTVPKMESRTVGLFMDLFIENAGVFEKTSFTYLCVTLLVSSIYSAYFIIPFFGLNDPVIAVSFAVFVACLMYDLMNASNFPASKFGIGLFTGTLLKEKLKDLHKSRRLDNENYRKDK